MKYMFVIAMVIVPALCGPTETQEAPAAAAEPQGQQSPAAAAPSSADVNLEQKPADAIARQGNHQGGVFGNLLQPLSPVNFLNNLIPGRSAERQYQKRKKIHETKEIKDLKSFDILRTIDIQPRYDDAIKKSI
jgi:hypothetical protein